MISFIIFNTNSMAEFTGYIKSMFGFSGIPFSNAETNYYLISYGLTLAAAAFGSTPSAVKIIDRIRSSKMGECILNVSEPVVLVSMLLLITGYLVDGSFNPFLYFRF